LSTSRPVAVSLVTALFFPGTVIHELSHLFTAEILGVQTGKLSLAPESIQGNDINVGSVQLQSTDPVRRSVIGLAPFFVGLIGLFTLSSILPNLWMNVVTAYRQGILLSSPSSYFILLTSYVIFCISNTMFASKTDMKGVIPLAIVLSMIGAIVYISGIRISVTGPLEETVLRILSAVSKSMSVVLLMNLTLFLLSSLGVWGIHRLWKK